jgi:hypothetical protein
MPNLGTTEGPLTTSGGRIANGELVPTKMKIAGGGMHPYYVSDNMSFGSYSGADIKVIVHIPRNRMLIQAAANAAQRKEAEYKAAEAEYYDNRDSYTPAEAVAAWNNLKAVQQDIINTHKTSEDLSSQPPTKVLGEIQTLSWGMFRDKAPVRTLGSTYPRAFTRGPRTISGTMIFTIFYEHVFHELLKLNLRYYNTGTSDFDRYLYTTMLSDQLPPIDISLVFANEYGSVSHMGLWGVEFFQEGGTFSIEDIYSENTIQYVARDIDPMRIVDQRVVDGQGVTSEWSHTASDMLFHKELESRGHLFRRNPFI